MSRDAPRVRSLEKIEQGDEEDRDDRPQREVAIIRIHLGSRWRPKPGARREEGFHANIGRAPLLAKHNSMKRLSIGLWFEADGTAEWRIGNGRRTDEGCGRPRRGEIEARQERPPGCQDRLGTEEIVTLRHVGAFFSPP